MEGMNWLSKNESIWSTLSGPAYSTPTIGSAVTECDTMSDKESLQESLEPYVDVFTEHCFKRYKLRERHPNAFLKLKPSRFGPAPPRRRIFIAPPMEGMSLPRATPLVPKPFDQKQKTFAVEEQLKEVAKIPTVEDEDRELVAWIEERKKLQNLLNKCADVESWLVRKESSSEQEAKVLTKIRESREMKKVQAKSQLVAASSSSIEQLLPVRKPKRTVPLIKAPYPESLITLQNLLHKQKLKLVDIFNKIDRSKTMKFKRADFIKIIEGTKVPINKNVLEDAVVYLTSMRKGNYITNSDLVQCQKIWLDHLRDQWKHSKEFKPEEFPPTAQKRGPRALKSVSSCRSKSTVSEKPKTKFLEVPPINTEVDRMHLTYTKMEEVGKRYKEVRRQLKRKITTLEKAEKCRLVKTGDPVVDAHCMPSTVVGDMGELVDRHRMACHLAWFQCVKLCKQYGIPLSEKLLQRALLYPGDKLLNYEGSGQKIRQPGGYYDISDQGSVSESMSELQEQIKSPPKEKEREREQEPESKKRERKGKPIWGRWKSYAEFRRLMKHHSKRLQLAAQNLWDTESLDSSASQSQMQYENRFIEKEMRKMFGFLNPKTDANSFWPGHLLDKLRLYLPQTGRDEGEALFSRVSRTRPVYPAICHPQRRWPVSELKFVTYGDPNSRKEYYYI